MRVLTGGQSTASSSSLHALAHPVTEVDFSPDGALIASIAYDTVKIFSVTVKKGVGRRGQREEVRNWRNKQELSVPK